jgi:hypothetical protein
MMPSQRSTHPSEVIPEAPDGAAATLAPEVLPHDGLRDGRAPHQPFLDFVRYLQGDRAAIGGSSVILARHRAELSLLKTDRALALLCRIEAIADHRADNDLTAVAKLPTIRDLAREAIAAHTQAPFDNPLFPLRPVSR